MRLDTHCNAQAPEIFARNDVIEAHTYAPYKGAAGRARGSAWRAIAVARCIMLDTSGDLPPGGIAYRISGRVWIPSPGPSCRQGFGRLDVVRSALGHKDLSNSTGIHCVNMVPPDTAQAGKRPAEAAAPGMSKRQALRRGAYTPEAATHVVVAAHSWRDGW